MSRWKQTHEQAQTHEQRSCTSKRRFETWDHALPVAIRTADIAPQRIYGCEFCDGFHITSHRAVTVPKQKAPTT